MITDGPAASGVGELNSLFAGSDNGAESLLQGLGHPTMEPVAMATPELSGGAVWGFAIDSGSAGKVAFPALVTTFTNPTGGT